MDVSNKERNSEVQTWNEVTLVYSSALKQINTKLEILNDEFQHVHQYNPIEHIKSRLKTPESIVKKLKKYGQESTIENMVAYVNDIAGIRVICSFTSDIYEIANMISSQSDIKVIEVRDYIKNPKPSGYTSYHMLVTIPIYLSVNLPSACPVLLQGLFYLLSLFFFVIPAFFSLSESFLSAYNFKIGLNRTFSVFAYQKTSVKVKAKNIAEEQQ